MPGTVSVRKTQPPQSAKRLRGMIFLFKFQLTGPSSFSCFFGSLYPALSFRSSVSFFVFQQFLNRFTFSCNCWYPFSFFCLSLIKIFHLFQLLAVFPALPTLKFYVLFYEFSKFWSEGIQLLLFIFYQLSCLLKKSSVVSFTDSVLSCVAFTGEGASAFLSSSGFVGCILRSLSSTSHAKDDVSWLFVLH